MINYTRYMLVKEPIRVQFFVYPSGEIGISVGRYDTKWGWVRADDQDVPNLTDGVLRFATLHCDSGVDTARKAWNALTAKGWVRDMEGEAR